MSRRHLFAGRTRGGGALATTSGYSKGCYVTPDLMLIEHETAARVEKATRDELKWIFFRSKREAKCWISLSQQQRAGLIRNLRRQVKYELHCPGAKGPSLFETPTAVVTTYAADFVYERVDTGATVVADAKGWPNDTYPLKCKWMLLEHGITIEEI